MFQFQIHLPVVIMRCAHDNFFIPLTLTYLKIKKNQKQDAMGPLLGIPLMA